jgi:hypothetical protein
VIRRFCIEKHHGGTTMRFLRQPPADTRQSTEACANGSTETKQGVGPLKADKRSEQ